MLFSFFVSFSLYLIYYSFCNFACDEGQFGDLMGEAWGPVTVRMHKTEDLCRTCAS